MPNTNEHQVLLQQLMAGAITPRKIIGTGYKYPKASASAWLRTQIYNKAKSSHKITECFVMTNGIPYPSETKAMASNHYKALADRTMKFLSDNVRVVDFGTMQDPAGGSGYVVFVRTERIPLT